MFFISNKYLTLMAIQKIYILGAVLELSARQLNWQHCLAGSSKTAPRILIFSIPMGADYSFEEKNIEIWAPAFFKHNNSFVTTVAAIDTESLFSLILSIFFIQSNIATVYNSFCIKKSSFSIKIQTSCKPITSGFWYVRWKKSIADIWVKSVC